MKQERRVVASVLATVLALAACLEALGDENRKISITPLFRTVPADLSGKQMSVIEAVYPPGAAMAAHRHPGSAFVYVLEGTMRSQLGTDAAPKSYSKGQHWFEPAGAKHVMMDNPGERDAKVIAILFGAEDDDLVLPVE